jgi:hypothetical protein
MAAPKGVPRKAVGPAEKLRRMAEVEALLVRRLSNQAIEIHLAKVWGITSRQVHEYVRQVRQRWEKEAVTDDRRAERAHMRASVNDLYSRALGRTEVVRDAKGNPMIGPDGQVLRVEKPDLRAGARAAEILCRLDGLYQDQVQVKHTGSVGVAASVQFVGRSHEDLVHFARTGRWPEEMPEGAAAAAKH